MVCAIQTSVFQVDKDPKYPFKVVPKVKIVDWLSQSPDLSPMENLGEELKTWVQERLKDQNQLHQFCQEEWATIPAACCLKDVEGFPNCVTQAKQ